MEEDEVFRLKQLSGLKAFKDKGTFPKFMGRIYQKIRMGLKIE